MQPTRISSPHVSFQQWLNSDNQYMLRCLLSNIRTRNWLCCWRTAGQPQHKIQMTHKDGIFSSKGALQINQSIKSQSGASLNCCLLSSCPFEGDDHRTVLLPVTASMEVKYPPLHKRFVVKLFSFVKPQTSEKLVCKLFQTAPPTPTPEFKLAYVVLFCFGRFISTVTSTSAKDQIAPSLAEVICTDLSVTLIGIFNLCHWLNTVTCLSGM